MKARLKALKSPVWIHAVSVGEAMEAISFIKEIRSRNPQEEIVFSCGTSTGFATAVKRLPSDVVSIYCPVDIWWMMWRTVRLIRPRLLLILEVEIWPNLIRRARRLGAKVILVNGRLSDNSSRGYARWKWVFKPIFADFSALCMQTAEDVERLERVIGKDERIHSVGTVKFDQVTDSEGQDMNAIMNDAFGTEPRCVFCVGSTHGGEEEVIAGAVAALRKKLPQLRMVLVPRHAERGAEVVKVLKEHGLTWRSVKPVEGCTPDEGAVDVLLVNTTGQLTNYYAASDICFVGKSLDGQFGGHNIIEPAIFGKALLYGPHMENFRQVDEIFREENSGIAMSGNGELLPALRRLVEDEAYRSTLGANARATVDRHRGSIARTLDIIGNLK
ncbi:MAG: hypothetical protein J6S21_03160 [Victivallales bacterium]|nr:hypothetical protein [Victivallales bacterium]